MRRIFFIFLLIFGCAVSAYASGEGWVSPQKIRTYIPPRHKNTEMMRHAFERWSRVTGDRVIFVYTNNPGMSDLEVVFVEKLDQKASGGKAIGLTHKKYIEGKKIVHATVYIADKAPGDGGKLLHKDIIFTAMLHEIGHAVGLEHVNDPNAIMNPYADVIMEISDSDMEQLDEIYGK